jgi:hypothetical protein
MSRKKKRARPRLDHVVVRADRREEPDWDRFAWALLQHARLVNRQRQEPESARKAEERPV